MASPEFSTENQLLGTLSMVTEFDAEEYLSQYQKVEEALRCKPRGFILIIENHITSDLNRGPIIGSTYRLGMLKSSKFIAFDDTDRFGAPAINVGFDTTDHASLNVEDYGRTLRYHPHPIGADFRYLGEPITQKIEWSTQQPSYKKVAIKHIPALTFTVGDENVAEWFNRTQQVAEFARMIEALESHPTSPIRI